MEVRGFLAPRRRRVVFWHNRSKTNPVDSRGVWGPSLADNRPITDRFSNLPCFHDVCACGGVFVDADLATWRFREGAWILRHWLC